MGGVHRPAVAPREPVREPGSVGGVLIYVYAIMTSEDAAAAGLDQQPLRGLGRAPVRLLVEGPLAAVISHVPEAEFGEAPLNGQARDVRWLAPNAVAHHTVNARLFERGAAVLPLSFGRAIFRTDEGVRQLLQRDQVGMLARLAALSGRGEWVLTLRRDQEAALAYLMKASPQGSATDAVPGQPGHAYLSQQRRDKARRDELVRLDAEATRAILATLKPRAERTFREALADGVQTDVVARFSLLVPRAQGATFLEAAERTREVWRGRGYVLAVSGPWPPYRFGGLKAEDAHGGRVR
jgi:Gas vesicle synthesis protein GvpL/GvpF